MNNLFRGLLAGYGAKKLGGGCFSTVLVFIILWVLLGQCGAWIKTKGLPDQVKGNNPVWTIDFFPAKCSVESFGHLSVRNR